VQKKKVSKIYKIIMIIKVINNMITGLLKSQVDHAFGRLEELQTKIISRAILILVAVLLMIGGLGMIVYSIHILLATIVHPATSGLILGLALILSATIVMFIAENRSKG
jgi:hypothetical protein